MADQSSFDFMADFLADIYDTFAAYVSFEELRTVIEATTYEALRASISGATRQEIVDIAREKSSQLITRMSEEMQRQIAEKIATGLEQQLGPEGVARSIRNGLGLDSNREKQLDKFIAEQQAAGVTGPALEAAIAKEKQALIEERARTIASTEMGRALEEGAYAVARERGKTHKEWLTTGEAIDDCNDNEAAGPIPIDEPFPTGEMTPPRHPNCLCTLAYSSVE